MTKWFDTNYHYLVPEFSPATAFFLHADRLLAQVQEAQALGHAPKPVLLGPLTFLWLGKSTVQGHDRLDLLDALLPVYRELLDRLADAGVAWVQVGEPILDQHRVQGAEEKLAELATLKLALADSRAAAPAVDEASRAIAARAASPRVRDQAAAERVRTVPPGSDQRHTPLRSANRCNGHA